jgi:predicted alpha/beta-fold hydrolase
MSMQTLSPDDSKIVEPLGLEIPAFAPSRWLPGGHAQTVIGRYLPGPRRRLEAVAQEVALDDGDRLVVMESVPAGWLTGMPAAVLVHGLAGDASASYMVRLALRLVQQRVRVVRVNLRGAGEGFGRARGMYHGGKSDDVRAVVNWLTDRVPGSPIALAGFSLGANLALKLAAEAVDEPVPGLDCFVAANPPIDLALCARTIQRKDNLVYDRNFVRWLKRMVRQQHRVFPELGKPDLSKVKSLYDFDDVYTAPRNGFDSAEDYYARSSTAGRIAQIRLPGLIIHALDDPFIPGEPFLKLCPPENVTLELIKHGGHLGYVSRRPWLGDHRWLEARIATWLAARWAAPAKKGAGTVFELEAEIA